MLLGEIKLMQIFLLSHFYIYSVVHAINALNLMRMPEFAVNKTNIQLPTHSYFLILRSKNGDTGVEKAQVYRRRSLQG